MTLKLGDKFDENKRDDSKFYVYQISDKKIIAIHDRQKVECWSRVMGYYSPISRWNEGKLGEWEERVTYDGKRNMGTRKKSK